MINYWLIKSEAAEFSIDDMKRENIIYWGGIRNYQARNFLRKFKVNDLVIFYHSNCKPPGAAGVVCVFHSAVADPEQFDTKSKYFDSKSTIFEPRWSAVDLKFKQKFNSFVDLNMLKSNSKLANMALVKRGNRLSIMPITEHEFKEIISMSK
jgi:predicted RNA-binding protein with PUA-like domain